MKRVVLHTLLIATLLLTGCGEDEYVYPPALTEILSVGTDGSGSASYLLTDRGTSYRIENSSAHAGLVPDTVYRMITVYEIKNTAEPSAYLYSSGEVVAPEPISGWMGEIKRDPVSVQSIWLSGDYLNMILLVKAQDKKHTFHFIETEDSPMLRLELYHDKGEDVEAYTQRAYLSVPLKKYKTYCKELLFTINTSEEGLKMYAFDI